MAGYVFTRSWCALGGSDGGAGLSTDTAHPGPHAPLRLRDPPWAPEDGEPDSTGIRAEHKNAGSAGSAFPVNHRAVTTRGSSAELGLLWKICRSVTCVRSLPAPQTSLINEGGWLPQTLCRLKLPLILVHYI